MNNPFVVIFGIIVAVIAAVLAVKVVTGILLVLIHLILPALVLVGAGYVLYLIFGPKSLGGSRRTLP